MKLTYINNCVFDKTAYGTYNNLRKMVRKIHIAIWACILYFAIHRSPINPQSSNKNNYYSATNSQPQPAYKIGSDFPATVEVKTFGALWWKSIEEIPNFLQPFHRAPDLRKPTQTECQNSTLFSSKTEITTFFQPNFFRVTRISHLPNFDMTSMPGAYCQW